MNFDAFSMDFDAFPMDFDAFPMDFDAFSMDFDAFDTVRRFPFDVGLVRRRLEPCFGYLLI